jgi:hypothetical protein
MQSAVNLEQSILDNLRQLPPEQPRLSLKGLWTDQDIHITKEDIAEARREMWGNFPREFSE